MTTAMTAYQDQESPSVAGEVLAAGNAMVQTRTSFCTAVAVQKPRQLAQVERRLMDEARLAGEDFYYGWSAGKDRIEGPSVELALAAARCWGNCAVDDLPMQETPDAWVFSSAFIDLETGFTYTRKFRQSKRWQVFGKLDEERKDDVRFQIGQSKAARNVILKALPKSLINQAMKIAKEGVKQKLENYINEHGIAKAAALVISSLARHGVKEERVLAKMSVVKREGLTIDHIVLLRGDLTQLDNGQDHPDVLFPLPAGEEANQQTAAATDSKMEQLKRQIDAQAAAQQAPSADTPAAGPAAPPANLFGDKPPGKKLRKNQLTDLEAVFSALNWSDTDRDNFLLRWKVASVASLTVEQADEALAALKELAKQHRQPGDEPD